MGVSYCCCLAVLFCIQDLTTSIPPSHERHITKGVTKEVTNEIKREDGSSFSCCMGCPLVCCVLNFIDHYLLMFICPLPYLEGEGQDICEWFLSVRVMLCIQYLITQYQYLSAFSLINVLSKNKFTNDVKNKRGEAFEAKYSDHKICSYCFLCSE